MFCLPRDVKHSRYKNMILKLTPLLTTLTIIKGLSFFLSEGASKCSLI